MVQFFNIFVLFIGLTFLQSTKSNSWDFLCFSWCTTDICIWCSNEKLAEIYLNRGEELIKQGKTPEGRYAIEKAVELDPKLSTKILLYKIGDSIADYFFGDDKSKEKKEL